MGGNPLVLISKPTITFVKLNKKSDFILIGCDGIFDSLENEKILKLIWSFKKKGDIIENIHKFSGDIADAVIKYSMKKLTSDNVTVIFIAFHNFHLSFSHKNFQRK